MNIYILEHKFSFPDYNAIRIQRLVIFSSLFQLIPALSGEQQLSPIFPS